MNFSNQTFENQRLELHGNRYHGCTFNNCELVYDGDRSPTFFDNRFIDTEFVFIGSALRTLYFMGNMYQTGEGGREVVEKTLDDIKNGAIHGGNLNTIKPHTEDHSLAGNAVQ